MKITRAIAKRHIIHFILLVLLVVVDQLFKVWARGSLKGNEDITVIPGILSFSYLKKKYNPARVLLVFIAAGGLGNIIDRVIFGYVTDFIRFDFIDFPVFNVADMYITVCEVIALILVFFVYRDDLDSKESSKESKQEEPSDGTSRF